MRKAYIFERLTGQVKRFAALMLITLMAVSSVFADQVTYVFSDHYSADQELGSGNINEFISFTSSQQGAQTPGPKFIASGNDARFYYGRNGNGQGNEMTLIPSGCKITGLVINAKNNYTPTLGCVVDGAEVESAYVLNGSVYTFSDIEAFQSLKFYNANTSNTQLRATSITITYEQSDVPVVAAPVFSKASGTEFAPFELTLTGAEGTAVYYTLDGSDPTTASALYEGPITINATTTVKAIAVLEGVASQVAMAVYTFPIEFNNLADIYNLTAADDTKVYKYTQDLQFVHRNGKYIYVQDETGGMLLYDQYNKVTTSYESGDIIPGGFVGEFMLYNGLYEMYPLDNTEAGEAGTAIQPEEVTVADILANPNQYMSKLVFIRDGQISGGTFNNGNARTKTFTQGNAIINIYNQFKNLNSTSEEGDVVSVVGFVGKNNNKYQIYPRYNADIITKAVVPFECSFSDLNQYAWHFVNDETNKWYAGQAQGFDDNKLYISSSNGLTNKYNVSTAAVSHAYIVVDVEANDMLLTFDCRTVGEANDFLQISVMDEAPAAGVLPTEYLTRIYGVNDFTSQSVLIPASTAGTKYIVFTWHNNANGGTQAPAAIDNVMLQNACQMVSNIEATVNEHTAVLTWNAPEDQNSWTVQYKEVGTDAWQSVTVDEATVTLNNLNTNTVYDVRVKSNCGEEASNWATAQVEMPCINVISEDMDITIGEGTSTSYYAPFGNYYNNSYYEMIYSAEEFSMPGYINSLSWYVGSATTLDYSSLKIYLGTRPTSAHANASDWTSFESLELVYSSENSSIGHATGWETYTLSTPYFYNGEDNLVVVVSRRGESYVSGLKYRYSTKTNSVLYVQQDGTMSDEFPTSTGSLSTYLPNIQIDFTSYVCNDATCKAPENVVAEAEAHTVHVSWLPVEGVSNYEVAVKEADNTVMTLNVPQASQAYITGLTENTEYEIAVRALCSDEDASEWTSINFTMPTICPAVNSVTVSNIEQNSATISWVTVGEAVNCIVEYGYKGFNLGEGIQVVVDGNSAVLTGLDVYTEYDVYVKADCGLGYTSLWSPKKSFMTECGILTITSANPFYENFDTRYTGSGAQALKDCWTAPVTYTASNGTFPAAYNNANAAHSGSWSLEVKGDNAMFTLPEFSNDITTLQINFWANTTAADAAGAGTMEVGVLNDLDDPTSFVVVSQIEPTAFGRDNTRQYGPYSFENVTPVAGQRIAFRYANTNAEPSWNFDDFTVELIPDCQTPSDVAASDLTPFTAKISWTENGSATAWNIEYGPAGFEQGEGTVVAAPTNPFTVTGLDDATAYDFYVQASCGQGIASGWGEKATVTTPCAPIHVTAENPWFEGFEDYAGDSYQPFVCWETPVTATYSNTAYPAVHCNLPTAAHASSNSAELRGDMNVLVLPEFDNNIYDLQVSFWATRYSTSYGTLQVGYLTDLNDMSTFVPVGTTPGPTTRNSVGTFMGTYMFPYSAPANARIALRYTSNYNYSYWNLDDFTVELAPTCRESSNLTASNLTTTSATINWTPGGLENTWTFQYMATSSDDWTTVNATSSTVTLNNLAPSTDYLVRVRPTCADEDMPWLNGQFSTECETMVPGIMSLTIGEGTSTGYIAPFNNYYGNAWTQMMYPASELSAGTISSISWDMASVASVPYSFLNIYLGTSNTFTNSSWVPESDLTLVYHRENGNIGVGSAGWVEYVLDTPYEYNGEGNLVVVVARASGSDYSSTLKYRYSTVSNSVRYRRADGTNNTSYAEYPTATSGTGTSTYLPNIKLNISGFVCGDEHCAAPENFAVNNVTDQGATLTWNAGDATAWRVGYRVAGATEWTSVDVANNTYTLTGLNSITSYEVRVKTLCSGDESQYVTANFKTTMRIEELPYVTDFTGNDWLLNNGTNTTKWYMGLPSDKDYPALYTSSDNGNTASYYVGNSCTISAEKLFAMPADDSIHVSFDLESGGEGTTWDFLKVFLAPSNVEFAATSGTTASYATAAYTTNAFNFSEYVSSNYYKINLTGGIVHIDMMVPNPAANGQAKLVFVWRNDGSGGTQPGAIVSNLVVGTPSTCLTPTDLAATAVNADGASTITWTAGGEETAWTLTYAMEGENATIVPLTTPTYTLEGFTPGDSYEVSVVAVCGEEEVSTPATITVSMPALVDLALTNVYTNPSNCDISNAIAKITVKNVREGSSISAFTASYKVNGVDVATENVTLDTPLAYGESYVHTFATAPVFTATSNVITATVFAEGESNLSDNTLSSGTTYLTAVKDIPYVENFSGASATQEWSAIDNAAMAVNNGAIQFTASDVNAANDLIASPCLDAMNFNTKLYIISYDYKAASSYYNEQFSVYLNENMGLDGNEIHIADHTFNNTEYVRATDRVNYLHLGEEMILTDAHLLFKAESAVGTEGFSIDNVSLKEAVISVIGTDGNGSVDVISNEMIASELGGTGVYSYLLPVNEEATMVMTPNPGYHVSGIYQVVNHQQVLLRGENPNNAIVDFFTFVPVNNSIYLVSFAPDTFTVNATVSNLHATEYNNNAVGATYAPATEQVAAFGTHAGTITLSQYFHLESVYVNGADLTNSVVERVGENQYSVTLTPVMEDKDIQVVVELDSTNITYVVNAGQGTINNTFVVDGTQTYPATYTETIGGYTSTYSTFAPAVGYHVASIVIDGINYYNIESFQFGKLVGNHTVEITFEPNHYVITTSQSGFGTVSEGVEFDYDPNRTYVFTATPDAGYRISRITRNNVDLVIENPEAEYTETLTNILSDYNYEVVFTPNIFTVTAAEVENGTITPAGTTNYQYGQDAAYEINADQGYYITSLTVDGVEMAYAQQEPQTTITYTFENIAADHTISATFAQKMFTVTVNAGDNGTITPATAQYAYGATQTFTIAPANGYAIVDVTVDGASAGAVPTYTFNNIQANHTIAATFAKLQYTIRAIAGDGGSISSLGETQVEYNDSKTYTITPNSGYEVSGVFVDGVSVGAVTTYTFSNVQADHTIFAVFAEKQYTITVNQPANGAITPGTITVQYGETPSFMIMPNAGDTVTAILVGTTNVINSATNVNGVFTYTFPAVTENKTLTATIVAKKYTITAAAEAHGTISNPGSTQVNAGSTVVYTITPSEGYVVEKVMVDGMNMGAVTSYIFTNVVANHNIHAYFKQAECEVPSFLYTSHIDTNSAILHWSYPTSGVTFDIQYKALDGTLTSITAVTGDSYQLTDLTPNTTYLWQIRANCTSSNHSEWSNMISFKTDQATINNVGIEDLVKNNIKVYAERQNVHILNNEGMNIEQVRIFDVYGKLLYSGAVNNNHEVIGLNVAAGTYIVNVATDKGAANYKVTLMR